jgi:hypothetical protein
MITVLLAHAASTLVMVGVIWFVRVVHYPLFEQVGKAAFAAYETAHARLTTWVVAPTMLVEALTGGLLLWHRPADILCCPEMARRWVHRTHLAINGVRTGATASGPGVWL